MLYLIKKRHPEIFRRSIVIFNNTSREAPETYDFVERVERELDKPIKWLEFVQKETSKPTFRVVDAKTACRDGKVFENCIEFSGSHVPSKFMRFCTVKMKAQTMQRYVRSLGIKKFVKVLGIRRDEWKSRVSPDLDPKIVRWYPMVDYDITKIQVAAFWKRHHFDLELPTLNGKTMFGNCTFCFHKSEAELDFLRQERPQDFAWAVAMEKKYKGTFKKGTTYEGLKEYSEDMLKKISPASLSGILCQAEDGECNPE